MNAYMNCDESNAEYKVNFRTATTTTREASTESSRPLGRRRGKGPVQFNGIHRRRTKKIRW
jgi:hypothetical protein